MAEALDRNPRVGAARLRAERAASMWAGTAGFYDPQVTAHAGYSDWSRSAPGFLASPLTRNAIGIEAGVSQAVNPGAYLGAGIAERYLMEPDDERDSLYQTVLGAQIRAPILRDRGFRLWRWEEAVAIQEARAAAYRWLAEAQDTRRGVERAYVDLLLAWADEAATAEAVRRAERLLAEAEELVKLKAIPAYQVEAARLDVSLNREESEAAAESVLARAVRLVEAVGCSVAAATNRTADGVLSLARAVSAASLAGTEEAYRRRGHCLAAVADAEAAALRLRHVRETGKPDVALVASVTWQGEDERDAWGREALTDERTTGTEIALVWRQALGRRREAAAARAAGEEAQAARRDLEAARLRIAAEVETARTAIESARRRLAMTDLAVDHAGRALEAENERFRMGEGRSRNVLDAQKDLTQAVQRRNAAAAALLTAAGELAYATGFGGEVEGMIGFREPASSESSKEKRP